MVNWRGEQAIELMQYFDSRTKYGKFGSETTIIWLFLSCYISVNIFLWLYYINKCISFETSASWLGSLLIFDQNFVSVCRGWNKNVLLCIFKNTSGCWGMSFPASKVFTSTKWYWFWYKGFTNNSPGVTWKLCLRNFKNSEIECTILERKTILCLKYKNLRRAILLLHDYVKNYSSEDLKCLQMNDKNVSIS